MKIYFLLYLITLPPLSSVLHLLCFLLLHSLLPLPFSSPCSLSSLFIGMCRLFYILLNYIHIFFKYIKAMHAPWGVGKKDALQKFWRKASQILLGFYSIVQIDLLFFQRRSWLYLCSIFGSSYWIRWSCLNFQISSYLNKQLKNNSWMSLRREVLYVEMYKDTNPFTC